MATGVAKTLGQRVPSYADDQISESAHRKRVHLTAPHVDSFNYFVGSGLNDATNDIPAMDILLDDGLFVKIYYDQVNIAYPAKKDDISDGLFTPREARERGISYTGAMLSTVHVVINGDEESAMVITSRMGEMPIMVMSERCHLRGRTCQQLLALKEEANEAGGYFVVNGIERCIRLLQVPRRNYAMAIERNSYKNRGPAYSDKGVAMRCVRKDQSSVTMTLHYLNNGGATLKFVLRKQEFLLPVVMVAKALADISDKELFDRIVQGDNANTFVTTRLELLLRDAKTHNIYTKNQAQAHLGSLFRGFLPISDRSSDEVAGRLLISRYLFVHTSDFNAKLECLLHMMRKLLSFAQGLCVSDNADAFMNHELLLPGHLINMYVKEKLEEALLAVKQAIVRDYRMNKVKCIAELRTTKYFQKQFDRNASGIGGKISTFLSTGNIVSSTGLDLMQVSGYTIVAERLNIFRYMSHFQSVHRGQFFTTMKTTAVRKLLPESWGFLCPVHTPDGSPCGLLNHMAKEAVVLAFPTKYRLPTTPSGQLVPPKGADGSSDWTSGAQLKKLLVTVGVVPAGAGSGDGQVILNSKFYIPVTIDGVVIGGVSTDMAASVVAQLRLLKVCGGAGDSKTRLDPTTELAYIPRTANAGAYPGLYIFTEPGRVIRPVIHRGTSRMEWIGPLEQVFMDIACLTDDIRQETTHIELGPTIMLSHVASLTPYSDYNQSPRNMYQCQMGKQTMGTPAHAMRHRSDNKLYRIQNPQAPLVQTQTQREYCMDEYPQGTNAIVAVISYTGYDMEDAMIINKASYERGFGHGSVYKTVVIDLDDEEKHTTKTGAKPNLMFCNYRSAVSGGASSGAAASETDKLYESLDFDGLPLEGEAVKFGEPICCFVDTITGEHRVIKHKDNEQAFVSVVRVLGASNSSFASSSSSLTQKASVRRVSMTMRYRRNPIIGDKFSSRHGQKGTLSVLWPQEAMPFSEYGMSPDVLINPHAFPSRMTIGMLLESMAGKSGAVHGIFQDATPFQFHEENKAIDYLGEQLRAAGYHYYGSEPLYNGMSGKLMQADIFMGVVYYQRLRHMVSDKSQVRSTGPVVAITRQPVKGRKKHGGIRLGEMERDALLSHGVAFCVHDRLMNCSDNHLAHVCNACGSLLSVYTSQQQQQQSSGVSGVTGKGNSAAAYQYAPATAVNFGGRGARNVQYCTACKSSAAVKPIQLPYVYRYLTNELAGMGIKITMKLSE